MNAGTAEHVGTATLKLLNTVNIDMWHHPKYYKELRKLRNKLDQAISSPDSREVVDSVRPDPGPKPRYTPTGILLGVDLGDKPQASSVKPQAPEATSDKHQAPSSKHQA